MHIYIYDQFVNQKKYDSTLARIETRITDLGLNGKIIRLSVMNTVFDAVEDEIKKGAKTIIAVGDNKLLNQVINAVALIDAQTPTEQKIPVGIIPIGKKNNDIAGFLGIGPEEESCNILSARRIKKLDLGKINNQYFLSQVTISSSDTTVEIDANYTIEINGTGEIGVINLPAYDHLPENTKSNAEDGVLELFINTNNSKKYLPIARGKQNHSIFSFKNLRIINKNQPILVDSCIKINAPADIVLANEKINLIVGKTRQF